MTERKVSSERVSEYFVEQVAKEIAKHTYARCLPQMSDCEDWDAMEEEDRKIYRSAAEAALSKASSVIAGLRSERITAEQYTIEAYRKLQTAEARISSLEEENRRLREALKPFADYLAEMPFDLDNKGNALPDDTGPGWTYLTAGDFRRARQALEDHNG